MGESGAPLIVQPEGMDGQCYVVGMHCAGRYNGFGVEFESISVLMTKAVV